ncbi:MAG: SusC/RagA family TonB-linked outer membrane protein [Bacteroidia bacterium]
MRCNKYLLLGCIFLLTSLLGTAWAQGTLSGKVTDRGGDPVEGATVFIQALGKGTFSDGDGNYKLASIPAGEHSLSVRMLGYAEQSQTVTVENGKTTTTNFSLQDESLTTEEVVVVGYGVQRKRDLVGAVSKIESEDLNDIPGGSFETALQGKAPGIQITQTGGAAGSGAIIRIRGIATLTAGGDPLIVVDGIPITNDNFINNDINANGGGSNNNPLAFLNPNDIESVTVLKDASATAIYGSRGANGVILITTKRGKEGKVQWNFNSRVGVSEPVKRLNLMNSSEWLQIRQEAWENDGNVGRAPLPPIFNNSGYTFEEVQAIDTDWQDLVIRTGFKQEYNLSLRAGSKKFSTYLGLGYLDGESYQLGNSYGRYSGRANVDWRPSEKLTVSLNGSLARGLNDRVKQGFAGGLGAAWSTALPIYPIYDKEGNWFNLYGNPLAQQELQDWRTLEWRTINGLTVNFKPAKNVQINWVTNADVMWYGDYFLEDSVWTTVGSIAKAFRNRIQNYNSYATANWEIPMPENHKLSFMLGAEYQFNRSEYRGEEHWGIKQHLYENPDLSPSTNTPFQDTAYIKSYERKFGSAFTRLRLQFYG